MCSTYFIAECGQNHNGSMALARAMIDTAALPIIHEGKQLQGVDAVKFTKRDLSEEMTVEYGNRSYEGKHAFGRTYLEHRQRLELTPIQHAELYEYAKSKGLDFIETICAHGALWDIIDLFEPDYIKVASRDIDNIPLLEEIRVVNIPVIVSLGMASEFDIEAALAVLEKGYCEIILMHCVSAYPVGYEDINLRRIRALKKYGYPVGYSDHTTGILAPALAVALGAEYIEKHITIDRSLPGTDQAGSLAPDGLIRCVRDIRNTELSLGDDEIGINPVVADSMLKLKRSICSRHNIAKGAEIKEDDLIMLSPGNGYPPTFTDEVIGKTAVDDIPYHTMITEEMIG